MADPSYVVSKYDSNGAYKCVLVEIKGGIFWPVFWAAITANIAMGIVVAIIWFGLTH